MSISFLKGAQSYTGSGGGNINAGLPAGTADGDRLLYIIHYAGTETFAPPAGWIQLYQSPTPQTSGNIAVFSIVRGTTAPATLATRTGGTNAKGYIYAYPSTLGSLSVVSTTPENVATGTTTHTYTEAAVQPGDLVVWAQNLNQARSITALTASDPAGDAGASESSSAPASDQWLLRSNEAISASYGYSVHVADGIVAADSTTGPIVVDISASCTYADGIVIVLREPSGGSGDTITVDEPEVFYEGASGSATITFSGSHTGATDTIRVRIRKAVGGAVVHDWQTLQAAVPAGTFSGSITVNRGGWYVVDVDKANDTGVTDTAATQFGVGIALLGMGQSELRNMYQDGTGTLNDRAVTFDGTNWVAIASTAGQARWELLNDLITAFDCPVALWMYGVGGTSILSWYDIDSGGKQSYYNTAEANLIAAWCGLSGAIWYQGHGDTASGKTKAAHYADVSELAAQLRSDYGASMPIVICSLGPNAAGSDAGYEAIRDALVDAGDDANNYTVTTLDLELQGDNLHPTPAGGAVSAQRMAQDFKEAFGLATSSRGPKVTAATKVDNTTVDVTIIQDGGTDFTPASGITGFTAYDAGTPVAISAAVRLNATTVRLTLASSVAGDVTVRYGYGAFPDMSAPLVDNTSLTLPLQSTDPDSIATNIIRRLVLDVIQRVGGAPVPDRSGLNWAFFAEAQPHLLSAPEVVGTNASVASGQIILDVIGTSLTPGARGLLALSDTDGTGTDCTSMLLPVQVLDV